jgi:hypothetical protein
MLWLVFLDSYEFHVPEKGSDSPSQDDLEHALRLL